MDEASLHKVLIVDDDADILTIVAMVLENSGLEVVSCDAGEKAVSAAISFKPDLIMLDAMMPGMDGSKILKALRSQFETKNLPVVFLTAKSQKEEIESFKKLGALAVLIKPFDTTTLCQDLQKIWQAYQESKNAARIKRDLNHSNDH